MFIESERLILKPYAKEDINDYHKLMPADIVWAFSTHIPHENIEQSERKLKELISGYSDKPFSFHALIKREGEVFIGEAGIISYNKTANRCVIGYNLLPEFWGTGYGTEISKALLNYAFTEVNVERVEALAMSANTASCKVLEKSGMKLEGVLRHFTKIQGKYENVCYYGIIASDRL